MFLKNYTSNVPVSQTIYRIKQVLIRCGASAIAKEYAGVNGKIIAITFKIETPTHPITIRLPADEDRALDAMWKDYAGNDPISKDGSTVLSSYKKKQRADFAQQAARTAWKIVQDWVEVQMSMIQLKQADTLQVFLPYVFDGRRTYYQALKESNFRGMLPEKTD